MKAIRKVCVCVLMLVLAASVLAAGGAREEQEKEDEKIVISYSGGAGSMNTAAVRKIIDTFNTSQDEIFVEFTEMPNDQGLIHDAYVTSLSAGGTEFDVISCNVPWPAEFSQAGFVLPLDRFIERDNINLDNYVKGYVDAYTFRGQMWGMPFYGNAGLLYYRTDIIDTPPATWDELISMSREYVGQGGTEKGFVFQAAQFEGLVCNFIEYIASYGGQVIDADGNVVVNSPETIKGLEKLVEIATSEIVPDDIVNFREAETMAYFLSGRALFARNWPYMWGFAQNPKESTIVGNVGTAPLPAGDAGSASNLGGWGVMINRYSKHPDAAWEFVKFLTGPEGQRINALDGKQLPTYLPLYDDAEVIKANPAFEQFKEGINIAVPRPITPIYTEISDIMQIEISRALVGQITPRQAVANMENRMKAAVQAAR